MITSLQTFARHAGAIAIAGVLLSGCDDGGPKIQGGTPDMRRLTEEQYHHIIEDVFGSSIRVGGRIDPLIRTDGLLALGARSARITPTGFEQYYDLAHSIADQVVNGTNRKELIPCVPAALNAPDDACAQKFFGDVGRFLYRRPLTAAELDTAVLSAHEAAVGLGSFYDGLGMSLAAMLTTPQFLFVSDTIEADPDSKGDVRLTSYAKASRLSFFLWNAAPDEELLAAAESGDLHSRSGLKKQVERMTESSRLQDGVRSFFKDMLEFELFETLEKDPMIYPAYSQALADDAMEQVLRDIVDVLLVREDDYRDLFTTRKTSVTPALARIYQIPATQPDGGWAEYEFPADDIRAGIVTRIGFTALHAHPGRSSPTLRGKALRETLLCQTVPPPPGNIDFTLFNDPNAPVKTARQRLGAHNTVPACTGCHLMTDPIGFGLENFDGIGAFRTTENDTELDVTGTIDGKDFTRPDQLATGIRDNPALASCVVRRLTAYSMGRSLTRDDGKFTRAAQQEFVDNNYNFKKLVRQIALSDALYAVRAPEPVPEPSQTVRTEPAADDRMSHSEESRS
ncbi:DUF1592 domain-containing protein [Povalibacter sp.]|uniref:DUF1592 domain-containing protein n=1 Tax=Povalibacter sp. TaxID=1962978 RepID=UPI002F419B21